jgi:hypothetical protein
VKIVLSRKGFDSSAGGVPSPIFPDGSMVSLPIPDTRSPLRYRDITWRERDLGPLVSSLTKGRIAPTDCAHLDPDLRRESLNRQDGWRPILGQTGSARGHLRERGIRPGDVFLFFGLFREVALENGAVAWRRGSRARHVFWGWLQIDQILSVESLDPRSVPWARYHPHFFGSRGRNNTIHLSKATLELPGLGAHAHRGAGVFSHFSTPLQLTVPDSSRPSWGRLPAWFRPGDERTPLSYHGNPDRWHQQGDSVVLRSMSRGQEFVLDCQEYAEAIDWLSTLIGWGAGGAGRLKPVVRAQSAGGRPQGSTVGGAGASPGVGNAGGLDGGDNGPSFY